MNKATTLLTSTTLNFPSDRLIYFSIRMKLVTHKLELNAEC